MEFRDEAEGAGNAGEREQRYGKGQGKAEAPAVLCDLTFCDTSVVATHGRLAAPAATKGEHRCEEEGMYKHAEDDADHEQRYHEVENGMHRVGSGDDHRRAQMRRSSPSGPHERMIESRAGDRC